MEESWFASDELVSRLSTKGKDYTETDKSALRKKQLEFPGLVLPVPIVDAVRSAARSKSAPRPSTTPSFLICDLRISRGVANPSTPLPRRAYRRPEDAREQLQLARDYHERVFGVQPVGLWPLWKARFPIKR